MSALHNICPPHAATLPGRRAPPHRPRQWCGVSPPTWRTTCTTRWARPGLPAPPPPTNRSRASRVQGAARWPSLAEGKPWSCGLFYLCSVKARALTVSRKDTNAQTPQQTERDPCDSSGHSYSRGPRSKSSLSSERATGQRTLGSRLLRILTFI